VRKPISKDENGKKLGGGENRSGKTRKAGRVRLSQTGPRWKGKKELPGEEVEPIKREKGGRKKKTKRILAGSIKYRKKGRTKKSSKGRGVKVGLSIHKREENKGLCPRRVKTNGGTK